MDPLTKTRYQSRLHRARRTLQEKRTIEREGVLYADGRTTLDLAGWKAELLRCVHDRCGSMRGQKPNTERAMDILSKGSASRWFRARNSKSFAGQERRGIAHHLARWQRRYGHRAPGLFVRLVLESANS